MDVGSVASAASNAGSAASSASSASGGIGNLSNLGNATGGSGGSLPGMGSSSGGGMPGMNGGMPGMGGSSGGGMPGMGGPQKGPDGQKGIPGGQEKIFSSEKKDESNGNPLNDVLGKAPKGEKLKAKMETPAEKQAKAGITPEPEINPNTGEVEAPKEPQGPATQKTEGGKKVFEDAEGNEYKEGDKVDTGRKVNEEGEIEDSSTKKSIKAAGRVVAAYYSGGQSIGKDKQILENKQVDKVIGVVSDVSDKVPGVKQVNDELDEAGVSDGVNDALDLVGSIKNKDIQGVKESAEKLKKDAKKTKKYTVKKTLQIIIMSALPLLLAIIITIAVIGPVIGGFIDLTDQIAEKVEEIVDWIGDLFAGLSPEIAMSDWVEGYDSLTYEQQRIVIAAASLVGRPYNWGGKPTGPGMDGVPSTGLDCSGYVQWVFWTAYGKHPGFSSTYSVQDLAVEGKRMIEVSESELQPGDIGIKTTGDQRHTGIYAGGGYWFHAAGKQWGIVRTKYQDFDHYYRYVSDTPVPTATGEYTDWRQYDSSWGSTYLGSSGKTLKQIGCLVTSISILISKSGVSTGSITPFNPGTFTQALNRAGGFTSGGALYWAAVGKVVPNFQYIDSVNLRGKSQSNKRQTIQQYISQGYYLTCEVKGATANAQHWVAVVGTTSTGVTMIDPASNSTDMWSKYDWNKTTQCNYFKAS